MKQNNTAGIFSYKITAYIIAFVSVFLLFVLSYISGLKNSFSAARSFMIIEYAALAGVAYYLKRKNLLTHKHIVDFIFIAGMILGVGNMLGTHIFEKGYDQGAVSPLARGHFGYILNIIEGHLPTSNAEQYYQPPLFHFISSLFVRLGLFIAKGNAEEAIQFTQIANSSVYCFFMIAARRFIDEIELGEKSKLYTAAIIAFFPNFFLMGLRGNNDMFAIFFMLICVINTYRWHKKRDMKTIICLALAFGFGMMSKISVGIIALFTAPVMIYHLLKDFRAKQYKGIIMQLAVFACICVPLALWYPIRNLILFDQPLNYVQLLDKNLPVYTGDIPWYKRFFEFNPVSLLKRPYVIYPEGYSIIHQILRTSLFAEGKTESNVAMWSIFVAVNMIAIVASLISTVAVAVKGKSIDRKFRLGFAVLWLIVMGSYIQFNISYPFFCTADFRYIAITTFIGAIYIGYAMQITENKNIRRALKLITLAFVVCSVAVYI